MSAFTLRPATPEDVPFLRTLFRSTREALLAAMPCDEAQRDMLCEMQFRAQALGYRAAYPQAEDLVVCNAQGEAVGRLMRATSGGALVLVDIALTPASRGRGIGTALIRALQYEAASRAIPLMLSVETSNPASALYRRMGFRAEEGDGMRVRMRWEEATSLEGGSEKWSLISEK